MPLKVNDLQKALQTAFEEILPSAFAEMFKAMMPVQCDDAKDKEEALKDVIKTLIPKDLSIRIAEAIDYYIKNADIYGKLICVGSPSTHTCMINSPSPLTNGKVPNTLGIK